MIRVFIEPKKENKNVACHYQALLDLGYVRKKKEKKKKLEI